MKLSNPDASPLMEVTSLRREGNSVVIAGTIMGSMPLTCVLTPSEARKGLRLLSVRLMLFLVTFLFRN